MSTTITFRDNAGGLKSPHDGEHRDKVTTPGTHANQPQMIPQHRQHLKNWNRQRQQQPKHQQQVQKTPMEAMHRHSTTDNLNNQHQTHPPTPDNRQHPL